MFRLEVNLSTNVECTILYIVANCIVSIFRVILVIQEVSGSILSEDAFSSRRTFRSGASSSGGGYSGIAGISAYQNLSVGNIGGGGPRLIGPPPPTPDPDDDDINQQLPIGDAWWLLLLMAGGYGITIFRRPRKSNK